MRILLVNRHYGGEQVPTGRMLRDVALLLLEQGHEVRVLTTRDGYGGTAEMGGAEDPVSVTCVPTFGINWRLWRWLAFWLFACAAIPLKRWDRCLILTDPPFMIIGAWLAKLLGGTRRKAYWWTMDLYPEALVAGGFLRDGGWLHALLARVNDLALRSLAGVVCLGTEQRRRLEAYAGWSQEQGFSVVVPPWDYRPVREVSRTDNRFVAKFGLQGKKIALYAGNLGRAHSFLEILGAARQLDTERVQDWAFVFAVRGAEVGALRAESAGLSNVIMTDYQPPEMTPDMLRAADVHLVTMRDGWQGIVVPSKLYGILRTEAPVLYIGPRDSDTADEIRADRAGNVLDIGASPEDVVFALNELQSSRWRTSRSIPADGARRIAHLVTGLADEPRTVEYDRHDHVASSPRCG